MKKETFYSLQLPCPACNKELEIIGVEFSVKGSIRLEMVCLSCEEPVDIVTSWEKVIGVCVEAGKEGAVGALVLQGTRKMQ